MVLSCSLDTGKPSPSLIILSPTSGWTYHDDSPVYFQTNILTEDIHWTIGTQDGRFTGNGKSLLLEAGTYSVTASYGSQSTRTSFSVRHRAQLPLEERIYLIVSNGQTVIFPFGTQYPALLTLDGFANRISVSQGGPSDESRSLSADQSKIRKEPLRDIHIPLTIDKPLAFSTARSMTGTGEEGTRTFHVINTTSQMGRAHEIEATTLHEGERYRLWKPLDMAIEQTVLDSFISTLDTLIFPRITTIWGDWTDIDQDGKIAILFCPTINVEKIAVGFFNPNDFFARNTDTTSSHYNPNSNEMDILYVAVSSDESESYSMESILATIGHELTHAITFSQKTWRRIHEGKEALQADLFLDEGWSHLSENLCGLGTSGGNIRFLERYLSASASYSFASKTDTAGSRGATMLFLSWLFWRKGGMGWNQDGIIVDTGGMAFLQRMVQSEHTGWETIGHAFENGETSDSLLRQMFHEINRQRALSEPFSYRTDPITGEPVEVFSDMGDIGGIEIGHPTVMAFGQSISQLPRYTFSFFPPAFGRSQSYTVSTGNIQGEVFLSTIRGGESN